MRRTLRGQAWGIGLAATALLLSGCSALPWPGTTAAPSHALLDGLESRVPLKCDEIFTDQIREEFLGVGRGLSHKNSNLLVWDDPLFKSHAARFVQAGGLICDWLGPEIDGDGLPSQFDVAVLPDVTTEMAEYAYRDSGLNPDSEVVRDTFGEGSVIRCNYASEIHVFDCRVSAQLADTYWITMQIAGRDSVGGVEGVSSLLETLDEQFRSAEQPATTPYAAPTDAFGLGLTCEAIASSPSFREDPILGSLVAPENGAQELSPIFDAASDRVGAVNCVWPREREENLDVIGVDRKGLLGITVTPGGEWYWGHFLEMATGPYEYKPAEVPGASEALLRDVNGNCTLLAVVDHSVVTVRDRRISESDDNCRTALEVLEMLRSLG